MARTKGLNVLSDTGSSLTRQAILTAVKEGGLAETNVNQQFSSDLAGQKNKQRAFTFRRTTLPSHLRKRLDSGKYKLYQNFHMLSTGQTKFLKKVKHFLVKNGPVYSFHRNIISSSSLLIIIVNVNQNHISINIYASVVVTVYDLKKGYAQNIVVA